MQECMINLVKEYVKFIEFLINKGNCPKILNKLILKSLSMLSKKIDLKYVDYFSFNKYFIEQFI